MLRRLSIRQKLFLIIGLMTVLVFLVGGFGFKNAKSANAALGHVYTDKVQPVRYLYDMLTLVFPVRSNVDGVLSGETAMLDAQSNIELARNLIQEKWKKYQPLLEDSERKLQAKQEAAPVKEKLTADDKKRAEQEQEIRELQVELKSAMPEALHALDQGIKLLSDRDKAGFESYAREELIGKPGDVQGILPTLIQDQLGQVEETYMQANTDFRSSSWTVFVFSSVGLLGCILLSLIVTRGINNSIRRVDQKLRDLASGEADLTQRITITTRDEIGALSDNFNQLMTNLEELVKQVKRSGIQVTTSSTHIAAGTKQLEATATEQAASTNEAVAGAKEISATAQQLLTTMNQVASMSEVTSVAASRGREDLVQMEATMKLIEDAARTVSDRLAAINEKAVNISAVVTTINKVADQTNLLSLNAAIEAEKAGEYGQGFAVVAREIRRLADQTAVATLDIEKTVKEMKNAVASGVMSMDKFTDQIRRAVETVSSVGTQLAEIIEHVQTLNPRFEAVVHGMEAQAKGAQQISDAMLQIGEASQQTAQNLRETNTSISELNDATRNLQREFARFKVS